MSEDRGSTISLPNLPLKMAGNPETSFALNCASDWSASVIVATMRLPILTFADDKDDEEDGMCRWRLIAVCRRAGGRRRDSS